jgi:formylglycine-generating enzyme required for sulfatase activity
MTISQGYWMGETEVTQELFEAVMGGEKPSNFTSNPEDPTNPNGWKKLPVEQVSWYDAIAFCNKLSLLDGKEPVYSVGSINWGTLAYSDIPTTSDATWDAATMDMSKNGYRLPTEMEWMWAAMGADTTNQPNTTGYDKGYAGSAEGSGQTTIGNYAWYTVNSNSKTHEVGKKTANELGLKDMSGNVFEWCWDWYSSYPAGEETDYPGAGSGTGWANRGGSFYYAAFHCTVAFRNHYNSPATRSSDLGFRVVSRP